MMSPRSRPREHLTRCDPACSERSEATSTFASAGARELPRSSPTTRVPSSARDSLSTAWARSSSRCARTSTCLCASRARCEKIDGLARARRQADDHAPHATPARRDHRIDRLALIRAELGRGHRDTLAPASDSNFGANDGDRTHYIQDHNLALCQLSYIRRESGVSTINSHFRPVVLCVELGEVHGI